MKKVKFKIEKDYKRCSKASLVSRASGVFGSMKGNPLFPAPPLALETVQETTIQLEANIIEAQNRDRLKAAQKNAVAIKLIGLLDQLAAYVNSVAKGDEVILLASGFLIVTTSSDTEEFGPVKNFTVVLGKVSGTVKVSVKRITGATSYHLCYGIDDGEKTVWLHMVRPQSRFLVKGLQPGKTYVFKMLVNGSGDTEIESEIITKIVA
ncbi:MAG: hypothetical protein QM726_14230 [Chitinophagaceae bacterium]